MKDTRRQRLLKALINFHLQDQGGFQAAVNITEDQKKTIARLGSRLKKKRNGKKQKVHQFEITGFEKGRFNDQDGIFRAGAS